MKLFRFQVCAISNEIQGKYPGKEVFLTKKYELKLQPDQCFKKIGALRKQKAGILGQVRDRVAESPLKERKTHGEIADLERNKPEVSEYKKEEGDERVSSVSLVEKMSGGAGPESTNRCVF